MPGPDAAASPAPVPGQNAAGELVQLERECQSYTRYLIGQLPTGYVIEKYRDFHQKMGVKADSRTGSGASSYPPRRVGLYGPTWWTAMPAFGGKTHSVRKKLILTLALIECSPPGFEKLDHCPGGGLPGATLRLGLGAMGYVCSLC